LQLINIIIIISGAKPLLHLYAFTSREVATLTSPSSKTLLKDLVPRAHKLKRESLQYNSQQTKHVHDKDRCWLPDLRQHTGHRRREDQFVRIKPSGSNIKKYALIV
jgi:hypothetical protein